VSVAADSYGISLVLFCVAFLLLCRHHEDEFSERVSKGVGKGVCQGFRQER
jgi:hypothetical protein